MRKRQQFLWCAIAVVLFMLTAAGEVLADDDHCPSTVPPCGPDQVTCGKRNCYNVCVDKSPTTLDTGGGCTFTWGVTNVGGTSTKPANAAIAYQCTAGVGTTNPVANHCGVGSTAVGGAFKSIFQLDSVTIGPITTNVTSLSYTINASCAVRGPNDLVLKFGSSSPQACNGPIEGFGFTNVFAPTSTTECVKVNDVTSMQVTKGPNGCATAVTVFSGNATCTATPTNHQDVSGAPISGFRYSGPPNANVKCGEFVTITQNSPVRFTYASGGVIYEFCYDDETGEIGC